MPTAIARRPSMSARYLPVHSPPFQLRSICLDTGATDSAFRRRHRRIEHLSMLSLMSRRKRFQAGLGSPGTAGRVHGKIRSVRVKDGGGGRTRTCEAMRRLIYSQLPLPLGTLPRRHGIDGLPRTAALRPTGLWRRQGRGARLAGCAAGAFMGEPGRQSQPREWRFPDFSSPKLPESDARDTSRP